MHQLAPSIIVKDDDKVVGYALVMLKEANLFHKDLDTMIKNLQPVRYKNMKNIRKDIAINMSSCSQKSLPAISVQ